MKTRKAIIAALGAAALTASIGGAGFAVADPIGGAGGTGGASGASGAGGTTTVVSTQACGNNVTANGSVVTRVTSRSGSCKSSNRVSRNGNSGDTGNANGGRGGNASNRF
jgi:hypothetical protein